MSLGYPLTVFKADSDPQNAPEAKFCLHRVQATPSRQADLCAGA